MRKARTKGVSTLDYKEQPKNMRFRDVVDKGKNIIIKSLKVYPNGQEREDQVVVPKKIQDACKKAKTLKEFRTILKPLAGPDKLRIDSKSTKMNLSNHDRTRIGLYNRVARILGLTKFIIEYGNKEVKSKK